jgi:quinone-modifying oxidoreductase subunit QmoA
MCPPTCGFEINTRRIRQNPRITVHTLATVEEITGTAGDFTAKLRIRPRYVTGTHAIDDAVFESLASERPDDFNLGMGTTKALYRPHDMAFPATPVLDRDALSESDAAVLMENVPAGAIDLDQAEEELTLDVSSVIVATGWRPYDATRLDNLGFGKFPNVVTNVMMERIAARGGPTGGEILRPSDGEPPSRVAFVQCAGSRDVNHLPYCSAVCCTASIKQARYVRDALPDATVTIFYIDIRTIGRLEKLYWDLLEDENVSFFKGKVAEIHETDGGGLTLDVEDTISGENRHEPFDLVVLATGVVPNTADVPVPIELTYDDYGFVDGSTSVDGVFAVGCAKRPCDVSRATKDATGAALKAIQILRREG